MKNLDELEQRLRGWKPRPPAGRLETRIFGQPAAARTTVFTGGEVFRWLAPAMACVTLSLMMASQYPASPGGRSLSLVAPWESAISPGNTAQNLWEQVTFNWTTGSQFTSTIRSLTALQTNSLIH